MQPPRRGLNAAVQGLTDMQRAFVKHLASGKDGQRAAELAGFSGGKDGKGYSIAAWRLTNDPRIIAALEPEFDRLEVVDLVPAAYAALRRAMSPDMPINMQIKAADIILRHRKGKQTGEKDPDALSAAELEETIKRLKDHAAALDAKQPAMIDVTPEQRSNGLFD